MHRLRTALYVVALGASAVGFGYGLVACDGGAPSGASVDLAEPPSPPPPDLAPHVCVVDVDRLDDGCVVAP